MRLQSRGQKLRPSQRVKVALPSKRADSFYTSPEWRMFIAGVIAKRGRRCEDPNHDPSLAREGVRIFGDHVVELKDGGEALNETNVLLRCGSCHTRKTAQARQARMAAGVGWDSAPHPADLTPSLVPLTIVCGPPAAGKNAYVKAHAAADALVIDLDEIAASLTGCAALHAWDRRWLAPALARRNHLLRSLAELGRPWSEAWFIVGEPEAQWRDWWQEKLRPRHVVVLATNADVCWARIAADPSRHAYRSEMSLAVAQWWARWQPRSCEIVISSWGIGV